MKRGLLVFLIILVAIVFRFQHIGSIPPGLYPDEAMNGNNAREALDTGNFKVFYPENNGREGLFINLQAISIAYFGNHPWSLRLVSAIFGVLTVLGTYFLAKQLFNWQIGALSSFLLAISFWHTLFSRIGFRAIMAPFFIVWGLYFFWKGLNQGKFTSFAISAIFWGLGFYSYIAFRAMPAVLIVALLAYWYAIKKDFNHEKYLHTRNLIIRGLALFMVIFIIVLLPIGCYFFIHPADFLGRTAQLSVFSSGEPIKLLATNIVKTLGMFNFIGDYNWRHNLSGEPMLVWPIGILFLFGFIRSWIKLFKSRRQHGHFSTIHAMLLAWFIIGLLPVVISSEGIPHALRAIIVLPVIYIFAGEALWNISQYSKGSVITVFAIALLLSSLTAFEYNKYFNRWATNPNVAQSFNQNYANIATEINQLPTTVHKIVLVKAGGVLVNNIPMPAQSVMFLTDSYTVDKQIQKNIEYVTDLKQAAVKLNPNYKLFILN